MAVLGIFGGCTGENFFCPGDICSVSWRYLMGVLEIIDGFP